MIGIEKRTIMDILFDFVKRMFLVSAHFFPNLIFKMCATQTGNNIRVGKRVEVYNHGKLIVGNDFVIGHDSIIENRKGAICQIGDGFSATSCLRISCLNKIDIGYDVLIGNNCRIYDSNHGMDPNYPYRNQDMILKSVSIGDGCWIGDNVIILAGADIGKKTIVAAGSVVSGKKYPSNVIIAGAPARVIKRWENGEWKINN